GDRYTLCEVGHFENVSTSRASSSPTVGIRHNSASAGDIPAFSKTRQNKTSGNNINSAMNEMISSSSGPSEIATGIPPFNEKCLPAYITPPSDTKTWSRELG